MNNDILLDEHTISEVAKMLGRKGGKKTAEKGAEYYRQIQKLGVLARKRKKEQKSELPKR